MDHTVPYGPYCTLLAADRYSSRCRFSDPWKALYIVAMLVAKEGPRMEMMVGRRLTEQYGVMVLWIYGSTTKKPKISASNIKK